MLSLIALPQQLLSTNIGFKVVCNIIHDMHAGNDKAKMYLRNCMQASAKYNYQMISELSLKA